MIQQGGNFYAGGFDSMRVVPLGAFLIGVAPAFGFQLPPPSTVGTVAGRVIEAHSGDPAKAIPKVLVVLKHGQEPGTGTYSDEKGNFRLQVEPGAYTVAVERNGYVAASSRNRTITVQAGQTTEDVNLELIRTGAVSGRIVDADGEPRSGVSVQLRSVTEKKGRPFNGAVTDDRGAYRIFQIPPGKYHLSAAYQPASQQWGMKLQTADGKPEESYITTYF